MSERLEEKMIPEEKMVLPTDEHHCSEIDDFDEVSIKGNVLHIWTRRNNLYVYVTYCPYCGVYLEREENKGE